MSPKKKQNMQSIINNKKRKHEDSSSSSDEDESDYETINSSEEDEEEEEEPPETDTSQSSFSESDNSSDVSPPPPPPRKNKKRPAAAPEKKKSKRPEKKSSKNKHKKRRNDTSSSSSSSSSCSDESDEYDEDYDDAEDGEPMYSIIITPNGAANLAQEYMDYFGDEDDELQNRENSNEDYTSEDERNFMKENYEKIPVSSDISALLESKKKKRRGAAEARKTEADATKTAAVETAAADVHEEYRELVELKKQLMEKLEKSPKNKILQHAIKDCKKSIKKLIKTARNENTNRYIKLLQGSSGAQKTNEVDFFKKKMSNREQLKVMEELAAINNHIFVEKPYRLALLETKIPAKFKAIALQKLNMLKSMEPGDNEYYKIKSWVDTFMRIPFGVYRSLNVSIHDGVDACHDFISGAREILDNCVYGHEDAKMQVLQMVGQWIANPGSMGTAIAIQGPAGTGKTSLIKDGVSKIFGREFSFLALGGATDSSFLEGHSYTYEGSQWGRIVQILIDGKTMNPVIFFDELDKVSDTPRGEEIIGVLTHLTDTTQNSQFHDKYFSELEFDLSKCLFVFSYNDESKVNPILKDRMYVIHTKGYDVKDKLVIARKYLLPKIREQVNFAEGDVIIPDDVIQYIVSNADMTKNEEGVRNLKRCLEVIHTKLNLYRLVKPGTDVFSGATSEKGGAVGSAKLEDVSFPYTVTRKTVDILIRNGDRVQNQSLLAMYV